MGRIRLHLSVLRAWVRRARFRATPIHARPMQIRMALAQSALGVTLKSMRRRAERVRPPEAIRVPSKVHVRADGRNVLFVSHCDFTGNSAFHVYSIAMELERVGWSPAIAVPSNPRGVRDLGRPDFQVLSFRDARRGRLKFADGEGPDLVHAWTPRRPVRSLTLDLVRRYRCPYVVHLEDNEMAVQDAVAGGYDPAVVNAFMKAAAGVTVVIDSLLELKPNQLPGVVMWPGYDEAIDAPGRTREAIRHDVGLQEDELALVYPGNVHEVNAEEVRSLYEAVQGLRHGGRNVILVKSGWNTVPSSRLPSLGEGIRDLGWIGRRRVLELYRAADILVQPGSPGPFNDYRFPSKLPEFLASGRSVVLPRSNVGLHLQDGVEAMLLERGDTDEIYEKVAMLAEDGELRTQLGANGRAFALRQLQWSRNVHEVVGLYDRIR